MVWPVFMDNSREIWNVIMQERCRSGGLACTLGKLREIWDVIMQDKYSCDVLACSSGNSKENIICWVQFRCTAHKAGLPYTCPFPIKFRKFHFWPSES